MRVEVMIVGIARSRFFGEKTYLQNRYVYDGNGLSPTILAHATKGYPPLILEEEKDDRQNNSGGLPLPKLP